MLNASSAAVKPKSNLDWRSLGSEILSELEGRGVDVMDGQWATGS